IYVPPGVVGSTPPGRARPGATPLSRREREVAALVARGLTNREIAATLCITAGTATLHVKHILTKLNLTRRTQVAIWALHAGLTVDDPRPLPR
ncbi:MAG TPA: LuxR C-terminal-related transcriptional regulator, partial [Nitrolancea sp.]|nr:LuxR C-terminal-related transcriptional regulator [Nitrolancea sp.]